jgi:serine/threonine-protein kinase PRP4
MDGIVLRTETASPEKPPEEDAQDVREPEPLDEASLIEERRKRREAIKAKYKGQAPPLLVQALRLDNTPATESPSTPMTTSDSQPQSQLGNPTVFEIESQGLTPIFLRVSTTVRAIKP